MADGSGIETARRRRPPPVPSAILGLLLATILRHFFAGNVQLRRIPTDRQRLGCGWKGRLARARPSSRYRSSETRFEIVSSQESQVFHSPS